MARGWESKDVESRQERAEDERLERQRLKLDQEILARQVQRDSLQLSRTRVEDDLSRATHPRHRAQLEAALAHLDAELAKLN